MGDLNDPRPAKDEPEKEPPRPDAEPTISPDEVEADATDPQDNATIQEDR